MVENTNNANNAAFSADYIEQGQLDDFGIGEFDNDGAVGDLVD